MIKDVNYWNEIYCDSCYTQIATCEEFTFEEGQKLQYTPILCESCGRKYSKFVGDTIRRNAELTDKIKEANIKLDELIKDVEKHR